jgi:hypothetical protein
MLALFRFGILFANTKQFEGVFLKDLNYIEDGNNDFVSDVSLILNNSFF